jgi:hypothetical protein
MEANTAMDTTKGGMLSEGLKTAEYSEINIGNSVCRMYLDGKIECKTEGEEEFTPRGAPSTLGEPIEDIKASF